MKLSLKLGIGILAVVWGAMQPEIVVAQTKGGVSGGKGAGKGKGDLISGTPDDVEPLPTRDPEPRTGPLPRRPRPKPADPSGDQPNDPGGSGGSQVGGQTDTQPGSDGKSGGRNEKNQAPGGNETVPEKP